MSEKEIQSTEEDAVVVSNEGEGEGSSAVTTSEEDGVIIDEGDDAIDDGYEISEEVEASEFAPLASRHLDDDGAYSLEPDVVLMRAQAIAAELGVEVTVVLEAVEAHSL